MRKLTTLFLMFLLLPLSSFAGVRNVGDVYKYTYGVLDATGAPVSDQTVALKIQKVSNGYWYDFNDNTFKNSGWTSPTTNLAYDSTAEVYYYSFTPPGAEISAEQYLFKAKNTNATYADCQIYSVEYQKIGTGNSTLTASNVWTYTDRLLTAGTNITLAKGVGITGFNDIGTSDVWSAVDRTITGGVLSSAQSFNLTGNITGSLSGSIGSISGITFPSNFALLTIDASGRMVVSDIVSTALAKFFTTDTGTTYTSAVNGSVVKEIVNNSGGSSSGDWTTTEKNNIKSALSIDSGTPITNLSDIKTQIKIHR